MNKSLDYNKLRAAHRDNRLMKKQVRYPLWISIKYDGNYTTIIRRDGKSIFLSSGNIAYTPDNDTPFDNAPDGVYLAERIRGDGKLGDRVGCSLRGHADNKVAQGHDFMVHDYITYLEYLNGRSETPFHRRQLFLETKINNTNRVRNVIVANEEELEQYMELITDLGFEGIMMKDPNWKWRDTRSRTIDFLKYKKRPTVDLLCIGFEQGQGKYAGMTGSLVLTDSVGREVSVGAGLSDADRAGDPNRYIGEVIEIEYEQILETYIQPVFITIRDKKEID